MKITQVIGREIMPEIIIDQEDYFNIYAKRKRWRIVTSKHTHYVQSCGKRKLKEGKVVHLHRLITNAPKDKFVDHIDGNGLNNQKSNLRIVDAAQNVYNKAINRNNKCGYKGVHLHKCGRYRVVIFKDGKQIHGSYFDDKIEAAKKYNQMAIVHFGEYARLNIIPND